VRKPWEQQESRLAKLSGGSRNAGSGNGWVRKADVRSLRYLIEAKWTARKSFTLKLKDLRTLEHQAAVEGLEPAFCIEFSEDTGQGIEVPRRYVVLLESAVFSGDPRLTHSAASGTAPASEDDWAEAADE
jgi:hypothetical protein